jgi:hypothetical protein
MVYKVYTTYKHGDDWGMISLLFQPHYCGILWLNWVDVRRSTIRTCVGVPVASGLAESSDWTAVLFWKMIHRKIGETMRNRNRNLTSAKPIHLTSGLAEMIL